jgi:hypothetical protein
MDAAQDFKLVADSLKIDSTSRDGSESSVESTPLGVVTDREQEEVVGSAHYSSGAFDANRSIHESHTALLYLLSHPEEFQRALEDSPAERTKSLEEWNNDAEKESLASASIFTCADDDRNCPSARPLPFIVFSDDAEVVLPQAHTVSQLFGSELREGIELEAAAGIRSLSQLFLRWLGTSVLWISSRTFRVDGFGSL